MALLKHISLYSQFDLGDQRESVCRQAWQRIRAPLLLIGIAFVLLMAVVSIAWGSSSGWWSRWGSLCSSAWPR